MPDSFKVEAQGEARVVVRSERVFGFAKTVYYTSVWIASEFPAQDGTYVVNFYDANENFLPATGASTSFSTVEDRWALVTALVESPDFAETAEVVLYLEDVVPNQVFHLTPATWTPSQFLLSQFLGDVEEHIPDFMVDADRSIPTFPSRPLLRWLNVGTRAFTDSTDTATDFDYVRAVDSPIWTVADLPDFRPDWTEAQFQTFLDLNGRNLPNNSSLTDPFKADNGWLHWLAQQVGVRLDFANAGQTNWDSFEEAGISEWEEWENDVLPGGFVDDTTWNAIENFDVGSEEPIADFRNQIFTGYNGVMSSTLRSIEAYIRYLLDTDDPEAFVFIRKHYRTNPAQIALVINESDDPDANGTSLLDAARLMSPVGTNFSILYGVSRSALVLYDANDIFEASQNLEGGYTLVPTPSNASVVAETPTTHFVEEGLGTGRHIVLFENGTDDYLETEWFNGGGIARSRFFAIVDSSGQYSFGHGLTSGFVKATTVPHASLELTGDMEVGILLSDLRPPVTGVGTTPRILASGDGWTLGPTTTGTIQLEWEATSGPEVAESTEPFFTYGPPVWLFVRFDADDNDGGHAVTFETAPTLFDERTQIGDVVVSAGVSDIDPASGVGISVFNDDAAAFDSSLGTVYRLKFGQSASTSLVDMDFLDTSEPDIFSGASTFFENGPNDLAVTITQEEWSELDYLRSKWPFLNKSGANFFHFGQSAFGDDPSEPTDLGDFMTVEGLDSDDYDAIITYYDTTSASVNLGASTAFMLSSDVPEFGGKAISRISIQTGASVVADFLPSVFTGASVVAGEDSFGKTWTLTRAGTGASTSYYEASSVVDRSCIMPAQGRGVVRYGGFGTAASVGSFSYSSQAFSLTYRRLTTGEWTVVDNTKHGQYGSIGWTLGFDGDDVVVRVSNGLVQYDLRWDEVGEGRFNEWNTLVLVLNPLEDRIELWAQGVEVDTTHGFFPDQYLRVDGGSTGSIADAPDLTGPLTIEAQIFAVDYVSASPSPNFKVIAAKEDAWKISYHQSTGTVRFEWESGGSQIVTSLNEFEFHDQDWALIRVVMSIGADTTITMFDWDQSTGMMNQFYQEVVTGALPIDSTSTPITLGSFEGGIYRLEIWDDDTQDNKVLSALFTDAEAWNIHSISGTDQGGTRAITFQGPSSIERFDEFSLFPPYFPIHVIMNEPETAASQYQFSQLAFYDHGLNEKEIGLLTDENS